MQPTGLGARYRMLMRDRVGRDRRTDRGRRVGRRRASSRGRRSPGIDQRGRWRLRETAGGRTRVELRLAYGVAGSGPAGWVAERLAAPAVTAHLRRSLGQLKRIVEQEQLRERAAERRAARAG